MKRDLLVQAPQSCGFTSFVFHRSRPTILEFCAFSHARAPLTKHTSSGCLRMLLIAAKPMRTRTERFLPFTVITVCALCMLKPCHPFVIAQRDCTALLHKRCRCAMRCTLCLWSTQCPGEHLALPPAVVYAFTPWTVSLI